MLRERLPFMLNNLYRILNREDNKITLCLVDENHAVFQAHFPKNPLLPGFLLIDIAAHEFQLNICKIDKIRFLSPIFPLDIIEMAFYQETKKFKIDTFKNNQKAMTMVCEVKDGN